MSTVKLRGVVEGVTKGTRDVLETVANEDRFCETCEGRKDCTEICLDLEIHLRETCAATESVRARRFSDLPHSVRRAVALELYGDPDAIKINDRVRRPAVH